MECQLPVNVRGWLMSNGPSLSLEALAAALPDSLLGRKQMVGVAWLVAERGWTLAAGPARGMAGERMVAVLERVGGSGAAASAGRGGFLGGMGTLALLSAEAERGLGKVLETAFQLAGVCVYRCRACVAEMVAFVAACDGRYSRLATRFELGGLSGPQRVRMIANIAATARQLQAALAEVGEIVVSGTRTPRASRAVEAVMWRCTRLMARLPVRRTFIERQLGSAAVRGDAQAGPQARVLALGIESARTTLTRHNLRLVVSVVRRYRAEDTAQIGVADLVQEGNAGLLRAIELYDYRRGYKFSTYATWWVRQAVTRAISDQGRLIRVPVHVQAAGARANRGACGGRADAVAALAVNPVSLESEPRAGGGWADQRGRWGVMGAATVQEREDAQQVRDSLDAALAVLDDRQRMIVLRRAGVYGHRAVSLAVLGEELGMSRERVGQMEVDAMAALRGGTCQGVFQVGPLGRRALSA